MILALSGGQKTGLLIMAAIFIGFALASSFLFPRSDPNYPGRRLPLFARDPANPYDVRRVFDAFRHGH